MNKSASAIEAQVEQANAETVNGENGSGLRLPPFNAESARAPFWNGCVKDCRENKRPSNI